MKRAWNCFLAAGLGVWGTSLGWTAFGAGETFVIPQGADVALDGTMAQGEWGDAREFPLENDGLSAAVFAKHDGRVLNLAFLIENNKARHLDLFPEISIDPKLDRSIAWQPDDHWFQVSATDCHAQGKPDQFKKCPVEAPDWTGVPNYPGGKEKKELGFFEISIPLSLAGIAPDREFGMFLSLSIGGEQQIGFPPSARRASPETWPVFLIAAGPAAAAPSPFESEKAEIARVVEASIGWAKNKDTALLFSLFTHDSRMRIVQPHWKETIAGFPALQKYCEENWLDPAFKATRHEIRDLSIDLSPAGDAAWISCILDDCGEYNGIEGCWKDTRWTGVLVKQQGKWVFTQQHFSFAADKVLSEARQGTPGETEAVRKTVRDYVEGWFNGDMERVDWILHPQFLRRTIARNEAGEDSLIQENREGFLLRVGKTAEAPLPAESRNIQIRVLSLGRTTATARVDSSPSSEHLSLAKIGDRWLILGSLYEKPASGP